MIDDLLRERSELLFVMQPPEADLPNPAFDYVAYFSQNPRFANAMRTYLPLTRLGPYTVYEHAANRRAGRPAGCPPRPPTTSRAALEP